MIENISGEEIDNFFNNKEGEFTGDYDLTLIQSNEFLKNINIHKSPELIDSIYKYIEKYPEIIMYKNLQINLNDLLVNIFLYKSIKNCSFEQYIFDEVITNIFGTLLLEYQLQLTTSNNNYNIIIINNIIYLLEKRYKSISFKRIFENDFELITDFIILIYVNKNSITHINEIKMSIKEVLLYSNINNSKKIKIYKMLKTIKNDIVFNRITNDNQ